MNLVRNRAVCIPRLLVNKDGRVTPKSPCRIQVPERWMSIGLGSIKDTISIYGFFPIIFDDNNYTVVSVCALMEVVPSKTTKVTINEEPYYEFYFDEGSTLVKSSNLVCQDTLTFNVIDEMIMKGKVPWWATADDMCSIFDTAKKHAKSNIAAVPQTIEFMISIIARRTDERAKLLRQTAKKPEDLALDKIEFVPLKSVMESVNSTTSKLSGAYFGPGVVSAIVKPATKTTKIEKILRA